MIRRGLGCWRSDGFGQRSDKDAKIQRYKNIISYLFEVFMCDSLVWLLYKKGKSINNIMFNDYYATKTTLQLILFIYSKLCANYL